MQYSLMLYQNSDQFASRTDAARRDANNAAFMSYVSAMQTAGVLAMILGIEPPERAATIRAHGGIHEGPYANTKEQLGGLCVIDVADDAAARAWAERAPFENCAAVEVRPTRVVPIAS